MVSSREEASANSFTVGLDPPTLVSLSPILRELAYKSSPRLIMSLRPQDPIPFWITHLAILGHNYTLALAGPKEEVLFAVHRWANAFDSQEDGAAGKMAALMTKQYGKPLTDVGHMLSDDGVTEYDTYSSIMSSKNQSYVRPTGEMIPEHLTEADEKLWREAAEKTKEIADLDDLLALTCLLPRAFNQGGGGPSLDKTFSSDRALKHQKGNLFVAPPLEPAYLGPLIEMQNVAVSYGSKTVLGQGTQLGCSAPGLNLTIRRGTRLAVLGPNGSGKTTLLSLLTSDHPQSYSLPIKFFGRSRLPSLGQPGLSLWEIQSRIGHSSPETHTFFPKRLTIRQTLESAWADTFAAKPQLTDERGRLIHTFLSWWEPELNPLYDVPPPPKPCHTPFDEWISTCYPPLKSSEGLAEELEWASSSFHTFGTLTFQLQRLLLFLRAIIKSPDIVILDEAFSGFSPEVREKAMSFLKVGERLILRRHHAFRGESSDKKFHGKSSWKPHKNSSLDVQNLCRARGIEVHDLVVDREALSSDSKKKVDHLRKMTVDQLIAMAGDSVHTSDYSFTGVDAGQALIVVSHVREEIPDIVNEYVRLPGQDEVTEQGRVIEMGKCGHGSIRTVEGWNRIWGLNT